jgi:hypothetical protein
MKFSSVMHPSYTAIGLTPFVNLSSGLRLSCNKTLCKLVPVFRLVCMWLVCMMGHADTHKWVRAVSYKQSDTEIMFSEREPGHMHPGTLNHTH